MSHYWWLPCALLLQTIIRGCERYTRLRKARQNNDLRLVDAFRWQACGHILIGISWLIVLVDELLAIPSKSVMIVVFFIFFIAGLVAVVYGQRRERNPLSV